MSELRRLSPNDAKRLEDWVTLAILARDEAKQKDRLTPRMEAARLVKGVNKFLDDLDEKEREFTHCPECGRPNGANAECESCADYRSTAAAEHQAAEQEAQPRDQERDRG